MHPLDKTANKHDTCLGGFVSVSSHHIVVHESRAAKERKAPGRAKHAAELVLGRFLQPMAHGILELLVPDHGSRAYRVNAATGGAHLGVFAHAVHEQQYCLGLEVHVAVQRQHEGVLRDELLVVGYVFHKVAKAREVLKQRVATTHVATLLFADELVGQQIVHVHDLAPTFAVADLVAVFQVDYDFVVA